MEGQRNQNSEPAPLAGNRDPLIEGPAARNIRRLAEYLHRQVLVIGRQVRVFKNRRDLIQTREDVNISSFSYW